MLALFLNLVLSVAIYAQTSDRGLCADKDLSASFGPMRNQGASSGCFAFAIADLIGYAQGLPPDKQVSALDVLATYWSASPREAQKIIDQFGNWPMSRVYNNFLNWNRQEKEGLKDFPLGQKFMAFPGNATNTTLLYNTKGGICTEKDLPSQAEELERIAPLYLGFVGNDPSLIGDMFKKSTYIWPMQLMPKSYFPMMNALATLHANPLAQIDTRRCKFQDPLKDVNNARDHINAQILANMDQAIAQKCKQRLPLKPMVTIDFGVYPQMRAVTAETIKQMIAGGQPLALTLDGNFLTLGSKYNGPPTGHVLSVVGTHWNGKSCEFKIRDSMGGDCTVYAKEFQDKCEMGHVWVDSTELLKHVNEVTAVTAQGSPTFDQLMGHH